MVLCSHLIFISEKDLARKMLAILCLHFRLWKIWEQKRSGDTQRALQKEKSHQRLTDWTGGVKWPDALHGNCTMH